MREIPIRPNPQTRGGKSLICQEDNPRRLVGLQTTILPMSCPLGYVERARWPV